ncbi:MAG: YlcI/YnfO family protein [Cyanobacteria bacterium J06614_10]
MSRLTLRLPETLHQQLTNLAEGEGVSLNQYIVYALTRQVTLAYSVSEVPKEEVQQQELLFQALIQDLGKVASSKIATVLSERKTVPLEKELDSNTVALLQQRIQDAAKAPSQTDGGA